MIIQINKEKRKFSYRLFSLLARKIRADGIDPKSKKKKATRAVRTA